MYEEDAWDTLYNAGSTPARVLHVPGSFQCESAFSSAHYNIPDIEIRVVWCIALSV